jgi:CheY-like chemotaxis protein
VEDKQFAGRHILLVEDEMMILLMIEEMLTDLGGASVSTAATVEQALGLIERQVFDVAMLDVNLNGNKSYPVADTLAARGVPFIFATGYSDRTVGDAYPGRPVLKKPFRYPQLADSLTRLLAC